MATEKQLLFLHGLLHESLFKSEKETLERMVHDGLLSPDVTSFDRLLGREVSVVVSFLKQHRGLDFILDQAELAAFEDEIF
jgi:hypothetical protein